MQRRNSRQISVGNIKIGGDAPISVQSMCNTKTKNIEETVKQILDLEKAGCDIIRVAVLDKEDAYSISKIKISNNIDLSSKIKLKEKISVLKDAAVRRWQGSGIIRTVRRMQ